VTRSRHSDRERWHGAPEHDTDASAGRRESGSHLLLLKAPQAAADVSSNPLHLLESVYADFCRDNGAIRIGGRIEEVSSSHLRVRGISHGARLGDLATIGRGPRSPSGEVVQIGSLDTLVAPFDRKIEAGIGDPVFLRGQFRIMPHVSWRGRAIDALGIPSTRVLPCGGALPRRSRTIRPRPSVASESSPPSTPASASSTSSRHSVLGSGSAYSPDPG
jgi:hypothetical protein